MGERKKSDGARSWEYVMFESVKYVHKMNQYLYLVKEILHQVCDANIIEMPMSQ